MTLAEYLARRELALDLLALWDRSGRLRGRRDLVDTGWPRMALDLAGSRDVGVVPPRDRTPLPLPGGAP